MKVQRDITVMNPNGLHARPAMQLVEVANGFGCDITITRAAGEDESEPTVADAKSVMQVITLAATQGTPLHLCAEGDDAEPAAAAIADLFDSGFGEMDGE